ncbi:inter-alpha-trypsin inhibitor heavy chain H3-like isoform X2 [Acanthaster planci]|uniref:Inter-alpha-trypsin inhibitor heavy chain H3-like isoform X2 n=1 Tax=Acanthaster planci TaxID=133434 RepID=A0A8B8A2F2_ACAPL|nr:inter-alpha-trypsin inhibitor heavy chain H3-like isoform X2 [Acanthaster planci]
MFFFFTASESQPKYRATFVMYKEGRDDAQLCFSVKAKPSQIYTLLSDKNEIEVNGRMASSVVASTELSESETVPLILDRLLVKVREGNLEVSPDSLLLGSTLTMPWGQNWKARVQGMRVAVRSGSHLSIRLSSRLTLVIHRHTGDPSAHKNDFLGLEIRNADGFSQEVDGIIGQFERREIHLDAGSITGEGASMRGQLIVGSQRLEVRQSERMDIREERARQCWWYAGGDEVLEKSLRQYRARQ